MKIDDDKKNMQGFTLIEISFVILIIAILIVPLIQMYNSYEISKRVTLTKENVSNMASAMTSVPTRYPCPSDRSLAPTSPNFGVENCVLSTIPTCTAVLQGIWKVASARDTDGIGGNDLVLIGGVPMKYYETYISGNPDLTTQKEIGGVSSQSRLDGWGNQLTYAVSANLTIAGRPVTVTAQDFKNGVISAVDENNNPTAGIDNNGQYAIISHGRNGSGAFSSGGISNPCPAGEPETENCDQDSTFMSAIGFYEGAVGAYFDDYTRFYTRAAGDLWYNIINLNTTSPHIVHRNTGNVGVNITTPPTSKLEVGGTLRSDSIRTDEICGPLTGTPFCFNPTNLFLKLPAKYGASTYSTGYCDDGQVVTEIQNGTLICDYPRFKAPGNATRRCPAGTYVREVQTNGCIVCNDGSTKCTP